MARPSSPRSPRKTRKASAASLDVPPDFIAAQIDAVFSDLDVAAVKIACCRAPRPIEVWRAG